jgi:hypothetical protein
MGNLISSSPICVPIISFSWLIALALYLSTALNKRGENKYPRLVPYFIGNAFSFPYKRYNTYTFVLCSLYFVEVCSFCS